MARIALVTVCMFAASAVAAADPATDLRALGTRVLADLDRRYPGPIGDPANGDIPALGACTRPTAAERAAVTAVVTASIAPDPIGALAFGCVEPSGIVAALPPATPAR